MSLNDRQIRFVQEYCKDFNATQAAIRAGYSEKTAGVQGHELLKNPKISEAVEERKLEIAAMTKLDASWVVKRWMELTEADPNELTQVRRVCCRHCHGYGHQYQWTEAEYMVAVNKAVDEGKPAPDGMGGFGFDMNREPHADCPECGGNGIEDVWVADTRKLKGPARRLFAGAERTRNGIKIHTRDQDGALTNLARYLGMMVDRKEISGPGGGPLPLAHIRAEDLSDDQLAAMLAGEAADDDKQA